MKILTIFGTRPEVIKIAPILNQLKKHDTFDVIAWTTGQHREILTQMLALFNITPTLDLNLMVPNQSLTHITSHALSGLEEHLIKIQPDLVLVQGDTTTAMASALAAFYLKIPVGHIEAGLRTNNRYSPFPEEMNRRLISQLATHHFAPTAKNSQQLIAEGIDPKNIHITGNTVIDSLFYVLSLINEKTELRASLTKKFPMLTQHKKMILVTCHRRENWGSNLDIICKSLIEISKQPDTYIIFPVHPNPNINLAVTKQLSDYQNIHLIEPAGYVEFIYLMSHTHLILSDSGGVQEEAPSLGIPVLILRDHTERNEGIESGVSLLVGANSEAILRETINLLSNTSAYEKMSSPQNPYGNGDASKKICDVIMSIKKLGKAQEIITA